MSGYRAFRDEVREDLGDLLWYAAALARRCDLDLDDVLTDNLRKTDERFTRGDQLPAHPLFDADLPTTHQLPRALDITFRETIEHRGGRDPVPVVTIHRGTSTVGDPLDDNRDDNDDYRYHDALHLGHLAVLGWSPVLRGLLKVKRKTDADLDRIQDGGRAVAIEEGLTAYVFSVATEHSLFATTDRVPVEAIKACQRMTGHLEVALRSSADWEQAILTTGLSNKCTNAPAVAVHERCKFRVDDGSLEMCVVCHLRRAGTRSSDDGDDGDPPHDQADAEPCDQAEPPIPRHRSLPHRALRTVPCQKGP